MRSLWTLADHVSDALDAVAPPGAIAAVVSRGDDRLLALSGHQAWHFPTADDGQYAGYHPADGAAAVEHLESLRRRGAGLLVIPAPSAWWLDYYRDLRCHLTQQAELVWPGSPTTPARSSTTPTSTWWWSSSAGSIRLAT
jgi:hypothetical protein